MKTDIISAQFLYKKEEVQNGYGMAEDEVKIMSDESVRVLVQRPTVVKKMLAKKAALAEAK